MTPPDQKANGSSGELEAPKDSEPSNGSTTDKAPSGAKAAAKAGGFKLSLASAKGKPGLKAAREKPAKRPRLDLGDDEPEDGDKKQEISGWDAAEGGAVELNGKKEENKGPRIIPALPNRSWREEARKRKLAQAGVHPEQNGHVPNTLEEPKVAYGLTTFEKETREDGSPEPMDTTEDGKPPDDGLTEEQRLEKNALDVLIHGRATDQTVIPIQSEEDAFRNDIRDAPDAPTLEAYEATPIEGFGAALLRGMGWKDGEEVGRDKKPAAKPKEIKRRPALLGIGAKEEAAVGIELSEWGKGKKKVAMSYNPVMLQNKYTGEKISEDELKARLEAQNLVQEERSSRSSRYDDGDDDRRREKHQERKDRDRREDDYDSERRRDKDRRDDRRRDREDDCSDRERRRKEKQKHRDDDHDDSDCRREKRRDKDRRDRTRSGVDYDRREKDKRSDRVHRHRSRSPDSVDRKEKRRERDRRYRDRSRSRDSEDRRKRRDDYDDDRDERKRRHRDDRYYRK